MSLPDRNAGAKASPGVVPGSRLFSTRPGYACAIRKYARSPCAPQSGSPPIVSLNFHPFDVRAEATKFFIDQFVATIDMVDAVDFGLTFRL